jgi:hypothetical protein
MKVTVEGRRKAVHTTATFQPEGLGSNIFRPDRHLLFELNQLGRGYSDSIQKGDTAYCPMI